MATMVLGSGRESPERRRIVHRASITEASRILLCLRYGIGDLVMQMPSIESLRSAAPRARILGIGARPAIELLESDPRLDEVQDVHELGFDHWADGGGSQTARRVHRWLDERRPDVVLNPLDAVFGLRDMLWERGGPIYDVDRGVVRSALEAGASGVAALNAGTSCGWGIEVPRDLLPVLQLSRERRAEALRLLGDEFGDVPLLAVSPVASSPLKRWPLDRLAAVTDRLLARTGWNLLVLAGPHEEAGERLLSSMRLSDRALSIGHLPLATTACLLERSRLFIANDTGLMHISSAVGTPTLSIFGPTAPQIYRHPSPRAVSVVGEGIDCHHRHTTSIGPPGCWAFDHCLIAAESCVNRVGEEDVFRAACELLDRTSEDISSEPVPWYEVMR